MKTYFDKDTQKWVSYRPKVFLLGYDKNTKELIYTDEDFLSDGTLFRGVSNSEWLNPLKYSYINFKKLKKLKR